MGFLGDSWDFHHHHHHHASKCEKSFGDSAEIPEPPKSKDWGISLADSDHPTPRSLGKNPKHSMEDVPVSTTLEDFRLPCLIRG